MSSQGMVILDEQDSSVVFTGQWDHYADPVQYKGISTGSKNAGTTCSLNFTGTSIMVVTTIVRNGPFSLQFILDGKLYTNTTAGLDNFGNNLHSYHDATFSIDNLNEGDHLLTISNTLTTNAINIYIDYFLYTPSSQTNLSNVNLFVDDRDPNLLYSGNWRFDSADSDFRHTSRAADNTSAAAVTIPFAGNGIQFYGLINSGAVGDMLLAEFVLDGATTTTFAPPAQTSDITYNNMIYDSGPLSQGPHKLVVTPKNEHLVWIDYVLVHQAVMTQAVQTTSALASATIPASLSTSSTNAAVTPSGHTPVSATVVAGASIGTVIIILLIILGIFLSRRKRRGYLPELPAESKNEVLSYSPYTYTTPSPRNNGHVAIPGQGYNSISTHLAPNSHHSSPSSIMNVPSVDSSREVGTNPPSRKMRGLLPQPDQSNFHTDSGLRMSYHTTRQTANAQESPPGYTAD